MLNKQASGRLNLKAKDAPFAPLLISVFVIFVVLYSVGVRYPDVKAEEECNGCGVTQYYGMFLHVSIMIFIGFGYLMTFLKRYGYSAIGYNFLLSCIAFLWDVLCAGFWLNVYNRSSDFRIPLSWGLLLEGLFGAGAVMISFGAVLGRTTISQLVLMAFLEIMGYSFNLYLGVRVLGVADAGGSMIIHTYGAYFGLSVAWMMEFLKRRALKKAGKVEDKPEALGASTTSDITAMIGTIFLWIMWPSFNAVTATPSGRLRAIANTFLSLCASVIATFVVSIIVSHKFDMVHVQNSTLAGGVAMGAAADMFTEPAGALGIGAFTGIVSVLGYKYLSPYLERKIGLLDTCGVHNLHGMPGVIGGIVSIIVAAGADEANYLGYPPEWLITRGNQLQAHYQVYVLLHTIGIAVLTGLVTGFILPNVLPSVMGKEEHEDAAAWEVQADYMTGDAPVAAVEVKKPLDAPSATNEEGPSRVVSNEVELTYITASGGEPAGEP